MDDFQRRFTCDAYDYFIRDIVSKMFNVQPYYRRLCIHYLLFLIAFTSPLSLAR